MKAHPPRARCGFTLLEILTYIAVLAAVLGVGGAALGRLWTASGHLRREADDLKALLAAGERWREDIRRSAGAITADPTGADPVIHLRWQPDTEAQWTCVEGTVMRRAGENGDWVPLVRRVRSSRMLPEPRGAVQAWRWDVELEPVSPKAKFRRQLTFLAVPTAPKP